MKSVAKSVVSGVFLVLALPAAACCGFGRWEPVFSLFAQSLALVPGLPGDYLRAGYYRLTLESFGRESRIQFGSFFAHSQARVGNGVYIGSYDILGKTEIGDGCQIASGVQILSGSRQHARGEDGSIGGADTGAFLTVKIGSGCWIGAGAIVMADVGENTTVGAGSVVTRELPPNWCLPPISSSSGRPRANDAVTGAAPTRQTPPLASAAPSWRATTGSPTGAATR